MTSHPVPTTDLLRWGGALAVMAGALRIGASFVPIDAHGPAIEALYLVIDVCLLFGVMTAFVHDASGRTRLGVAGFVTSLIGIGLLIGPEPAEGAVDVYALGAAAVSVGLALLAWAWRRGDAVPVRVTSALLAAPLVGMLGYGTGLDVLVAASGVLFGLGLIGVGTAVVRGAGSLAPRVDAA